MFCRFSPAKIFNRRRPCVGSGFACTYRGEKFGPESSAGPDDCVRFRSNAAAHERVVTWPYRRRWRSGPQGNWRARTPAADQPTRAHAPDTLTATVDHGWRQRRPEIERGKNKNDVRDTKNVCHPLSPTPPSLPPPPPPPLTECYRGSRKDHLNKRPCTSP